MLSPNYKYILILFNSLFVDHSQHGVHEQGDIGQGGRNLCVPAKDRCRHHFCGRNCPNEYFFIYSDNQCHNLPFCVWYSWVASLPARITFTILHIFNVSYHGCLVCFGCGYSSKNLYQYPSQLPYQSISKLMIFKISLLPAHPQRGETSLFGCLRTWQQL